MRGIHPVLKVIPDTVDIEKLTARWEQMTPEQQAKHGGDRMRWAESLLASVANSYKRATGITVRLGR
jgi:hypothetical protein